MQGKRESLTVVSAGEMSAEGLGRNYSNLRIVRNVMRGYSPGAPPIFRANNAMGGKR
jgi:hypothetical protein